jgi:hypothetical protein
VRRELDLHAVDGRALAHIGLLARVEKVHVGPARLELRPAAFVGEDDPGKDVLREHDASAHPACPVREFDLIAGAEASRLGV